METSESAKPHAALAYIVAHRTGARLVFCALLYANVFTGYYAYRAFREKNTFSVKMLNVGQGDSALVSLPGNIRLLVDTGPPNKQAVRALASALGPFVQRIDLATISHPQLDHAGGMPDILRSYTLGALLESKTNSARAGNNSALASLESTLSKNRVQRITFRGGDRIRHDKDTVTVLWPPKNQPPPKDINETSLVILVESGETRALFTGDISSKTERALIPVLQRLGTARIDILKTAHHGSKYSTSDAFLNVARPRIALIGVGKNSYGHPATSTLEHLKQNGTRIFRTDHNGTITISIHNGKATIKHR